SATVHFAETDQSHNFVDYSFNRDLLTPLEPGSILLLKGDLANFGVAYLQLAEGYRRDVIALNIEQLSFRWYTAEIHRHFPDLVLPFDAYDPNRGNSLKDLVDANMASRSVYLLGDSPTEPNFRAAYDVARAGLADRLLP